MLRQRRPKAQQSGPDADAAPARAQRTAGERRDAPSVASRAAIPLAAAMTLLAVWLAVVATRLHLPPPESPLFSEGNARKTIVDMVEIGPRVVGSAAEGETAHYLLARLSALLQDAGVDPASAIHVQHAEGAFFLEYRGMHGIMNAYQQVTNIAVRVLPESGVADSALLLSSHYDSMPFSPGASDNAAAVAVLLEALRTFLRDRPVEHALMLLFNGSEEMGLQAVHGFIEQHPWAETVDAVINLDSGGVGGQSILLQAGPRNAWIANVFAQHAPFPHGSVLAQDLFQSGAIPSDTDYRVYAEHHDSANLDICFFQGGAGYHTHLDRLDRMPVGSLANMGGNVVAVARALLDRPSLRPTDPAAHADQMAVFYDFASLFMVTYPWQTAEAIHAVACVLAVLAVLALAKHALTGLFFSVVSLLAGVGVSLAVAAVLQFGVESRIPFYSHEWIAGALYGGATVAGVTAAQLGLAAAVATPAAAGVAAAAGNVLLWAAVLGLMTWAQLGSSYLFLWLLGGAVAVLFAAAHGRMPALLAVGIAGQLPGILLLCDAAHGALAVFVPISGRIGYAPANVVLGILVGLIVAILWVQMTPLLQHARSAIMGGVILGSLVVLAVGLAADFSLDTYDAEHPKRVFMQGTIRPDTPPYMLIMSVDAEPLETVLAASDPALGAAVIERMERPRPDDVQAVYPLALEILADTVVVPVELPGLASPRVDVVADAWDEAAQIRRLSLAVVNCPDGRNATVECSRYTTFNFTAPLVEWSLSDELPETIDGAYFVRKVASVDAPWKLDLAVASREPFEIHITSTFFSHRPASSRFIAMMPEWTTPAYWISLMTDHLV